MFITKQIAVPALIFTKLASALLIIIIINNIIIIIQCNTLYRIPPNRTIKVGSRSINLFTLEYRRILLS